MQAAAKACLVLPLLLGACVSPPSPAPGTEAFLPPGPGPGRSTLPAPPPAAPAPQPQPQDPLPAETASKPAVPTPSAAPGGPSPGSFAQPVAPEDATIPGAGRAPATETPAPTPQAPAPGIAAPRAVTAYYVLLDDGGSNGVRFGCNDSLVGMERPASDGEDPLPAAMSALLDGTSGSEAPASGSKPERGMYNALAGSGLKFLSGTFDGTTVTVYLVGTLSPGGVCDVPRIEAQLTQTAVAAFDAIRAEVYVNGRPLAESLMHK
ncbi:GerMN domain-containing protein [Pseudarthrobacter sp. NS4]|uniref:GerMN domain-containing protein n=1 Tax=Pseudarthrobacter sp. NS4 TaxID=2973976 RepID=UPI0021637103|nr:GerMN domain-containing protein [Pseudarthrobacter sp. NS4]